MTVVVSISLVSTLFLAVGWNLVCPTEGFIPNIYLETGAKALSFSFEDAINHEEMTKNAHLQVAAEVLRDNPNSGSSQRLSAVSNIDEKSLITAYFGQADHDRINEFKSAVEVVQDANSDVDFGEEKDLAAAHFDSEQLQSGQDRLIQLRQNVISSILNGDYDKARRQDAYFMLCKTSTVTPTGLKMAIEYRIMSWADQMKVSKMWLVHHSKPVQTAQRRVYFSLTMNVKIILCNP